MYDFAAITDIGPQFSVNDDRILVKRCILDEGSMSGKITDPCFIIAVADGVGGLPFGYAAAETALKSLSELNAPDMGRLEIRRAIENANRKIRQRQIETDAYSGFRTTLAAIYISGGTCCVMNAGDSRVYRYRDNLFEQLSKDHSVVQNMIDVGELTVEEAFTHPKKNLITKCLGDEEKVNARIIDCSGDMKINDIFLLCSDGISDCLRDAEIAELIDENKEIPLLEICQKLISKALANGSTDNISVCLMRKES